MDKNYVISAGQTADFRNNAFVCVGTGRMALAMQECYLKDLAFIQQELGFEYIRGHGLFCDAMAIYDPYKDEDGTEHEHYNFTYLDRVFDAYLKLKIKPFIELGFMPEKMASGTQAIFWWRGNTTPPKDYDMWGRMVSALIQHCVERYGREQVVTWPVEVWNEPNLPGFWKDADQPAYLQLYKHSVTAVKRVLPEMKVGGPAVCGGDACLPWIRAFLTFCTENDLPVDFLARHIYMAQTPTRKGRYTYHEMCAPEFSVHEAEETRALVDSFPRFKGIPLHITEYNTSYNPRCPTHDTIYNAAVICGMLSRMGDVCDSYSYWTFSDVFEEVGPYDRPFHGGFGLLADRGIPKPTFWTYKFFSDLKGKCLLHEDDSVVTLDEKGVYHGVVWNLCKEEKTERKISLKIENGSKYMAVLRVVDHENANPLRVWHEMGEPCTLNDGMLRVLKEAAVPGIRAFRMDGDTLKITLSPNAVVGIELIPECKGMSPGYEYPENEN